MYLSVDNPGKGNCAFYSYSIGLIDIIKHEISKHSISPTFNRWAEHCPELENTLARILAFDYNYKRQDTDLLNTLQASLRNLIYQHQYGQLEKGLTEVGRATQNSHTARDLKEYITDTSVFSKFAEIFWALYNRRPYDKDYNDLAESREVVDLAKKLNRRITRLSPWMDLHSVRTPLSPEHLEYINAQIAHTFLYDVYGLSYNDPDYDMPLAIQEDSMIVEGLARIKQNYVWGNFADLNLLSEIFDLNLHYIMLDSEGKEIPTYPFQNLSGKPVLTVVNEDNMHWTTRITTSNAIKNDSTTKYHKHATDTLVTKKEIQNIFLSYTTGFIAFFGRNHRAKAEEIIAACKNNEKTVDDVIQIINDYITNDRIHFNNDSSFRKRTDYILERFDFYNGFDLEQAYQFVP